MTMSDKGTTCQHEWFCYTDWRTAYQGTRWLCRTCSLDINNFEWLDRYAAYRGELANISIGVPDADTEEEFLKNAKKAWLEQHEEER